ncbi:TIGR02281 family clan AA aspartic protease [soil metagenome]
MRAVLTFIVIGGGIAWWAVTHADQVVQLKADTVATQPAPAAAPSKSIPPGGRKVAIPADVSGHYLSDAVINGRSIRVVVDTGATSVALSSDTAKRLGLKIDPGAYALPVSTANGVTMGARVILSEVRIGAITVSNVEALVMKGGALGDVSLLGMSFLSKLRKFEVGGGQLVLMQ